MRSTKWHCAAVAAVACQTALLGGLAPADSPDGGPENHDAAWKQPRPVIVVLRLENEAITPITARFVARAIDDAASAGAECLVILLDTPGGLVDSTRRLVKAILASPVPVVVFVAPQGARAASAGMFITMAAHVAAMAPGTNIGAAAPVSLGGDLPFAPPDRPAESDDPEGDEQRRPAAGEMKAINDTVAWAQALASLRGRNAEWATQAVRESVSAPATEAIEAGAVDLIADDLNDLLHRIDGRAVTTPGGPRTLRTATATIIERPMWWGEQALSALASPNVAFLLLVLGFYGVLFELYSPGWGVPGTLGAICLALSFFSLAFLPVQIVGLLLVMLGLAMFAAEIFVTSFGALSLGGALCLVLGGLMLVDSPAGFAGVSLTLLLPVALATALITFVLVGSILKTHRTRVLTGSEAQLGASTIADDDFHRVGGTFAGPVRLHGEIWRATADGPVSHGASLEVVSRDGLTLHVRPHPASSSPADIVPKTISPS